MSERTWTDEQKHAIYARGGSVLVSAAAGSGKTAVLVERVIQMVCDTATPHPIDRFLIVTFTKAAAAEMRERIVNVPNIFHEFGITRLNIGCILVNHQCLVIVNRGDFRVGLLIWSHRDEVFFHCHNSCLIFLGFYFVCFC